MYTTLYRITTVALLATVASACDRAPTSPSSLVAAQRTASLSANTTGGAEREIVERLSDFTDALVSFPCGDEYTEQVRMEGAIFERYTITRDGSGGIHALIHTMPIGLRGIGLSTGAEYRISEREHGVFNQGAMEQTVSSYQSRLVVSAPEIHLRAALVVGGRFVVNANGELIIDRPVLRSECQL